VNPVDSLPVIAEISLGLVGFTAVVAVLRRPDNLNDLVSALLLLAYSSATLVLALVPFLFTAMGSGPEATWRLSSLVMLLCSLVGLASYPKTRNTIPAVASRRTVAILSVGALNAILQLANAAGVFGAPRFWPFLLGLLWYVIFCLAMFASLLFPQPSE